MPELPIEQLFDLKRSGFKKTVFIVNSSSGTGKCAARFESVKKVFDDAGLSYSVVFTKAVGDAAALCKTAVNSEAEMIVAVGGDGTVREVASEIYAHGCMEMGILPFGTGNDFAAALDIPSDDKSAAELILFGSAKSCDLLNVNDSICTNVCGLGFDVEVLRNTEKHKKGRSGMLPYALGILSALLKRKRIRARVSIDGGAPESVDALLINACNGKRFGGGMLVAPEASAYDGKIDIMIAKWVGLLKMVLLLPSFIKGGHIKKKQVLYMKATELSVETDEAFTVQADGELIERTPLHVKLIPNAISIIRP